MKMERFGYYLLCVFALLSAVFLYWQFHSGWFFLLLIYPFWFTPEKKKRAMPWEKDKSQNT